MDILVYSLNASTQSRIIADGVGVAVDESTAASISVATVVDDAQSASRGCNPLGTANLSSSEISQQHSDYLNELFREKFNDATVIVSVVVLVLINFVVIAGNILVILSVFTSPKLRTVTNFFIGKIKCVFRWKINLPRLI